MAMHASKPRILITGAEGQLGWELARTFSTVGEVMALDRTSMDLSSPDAIRARCRELKPSLILNAAAYTAVDKAEIEPELAMRINAESPGILAEEANRLGATLVHYSTDYVFDGTAQQPYREDDAPNPQNVYGRTKLAGEQAVAGIAKQYLVLRTSWLYSNRRQNFLLTMLRLARERDELRIVADQFGSPTWVRPVSEVTAKCLSTEPGPSGAARLNIEPGIYHLTAAGQTSWHGFASAILEANAEAVRATRVVAISTVEFPTPARRPAYSVLALNKLEMALGTTMPHWRKQLYACLAEPKENF